MIKRILHVTVLVLLCLTGLFASSLLLQEHMNKTTGNAWFDRVCGESQDEGVSNCEKVIKSPWGMVLGRLTSYWGVAYFLGLTFWFVLIGRPSYSRRFWHLVPIVVTAMGAVGSVFFIGVMYFKLEHRCVWCLIAHAANFGILVLTILMWPRRPAPLPTEGAADLAAKPRRVPQNHPTVRLAIAVILLTLVTNNHVWRGVLMSKVMSRMFYQNYADSPSLTIALRDDDPRKDVSGALAPIQTVLFTDFQCANCRRLSEAIEEKINPMFDGRLQITFKHFPLCSDCNPYIKNRYNDVACQAARAAEAARMQGGNAAFWKAHAALFDAARAKRLDELSYRVLARDLGLDPERFVADMESEDAAKRIREDIELGHSLGVSATPAAFVAGKAVPPGANLQFDFWRALAAETRKPRGR